MSDSPIGLKLHKQLNKLISFSSTTLKPNHNSGKLCLMFQMANLKQTLGI